MHNEGLPMDLLQEMAAAREGAQDQNLREGPQRLEGASPQPWKNWVDSQSVRLDVAMPGTNI